MEEKYENTTINRIKSEIYKILIHVELWVWFGGQSTSIAYHVCVYMCVCDPFMMRHVYIDRGKNKLGEHEFSREMC